MKYPRSREVARFSSNTQVEIQKDYSIIDFAWSYQARLKCRCKVGPEGGWVVPQFSDVWFVPDFETV